MSVLQIIILALFIAFIVAILRIQRNHHLAGCPLSDGDHVRFAEPVRMDDNSQHRVFVFRQIGTYTFFQRSQVYYTIPDWRDRAYDVLVRA